MPNRRLSRFGGGVREDQDADDEPDPESEPDDDASTCDDCGSPNVYFEDASAHSAALPPKPLCRSCILDYV